MRLVRGLLVLILLVSAGMALGQTTGTINGKVVDASGDPLPGVTVVAESPQMIGTRTDVSREGGQFLFRRIPPGKYTLTATMAGMRTEKMEIVLELSSVVRPTIVMKPETTTEELTVTASMDPVLDTVEVAANFDSDFINKLATTRDQAEIARLAPGASYNGGGDVSISGANSGANTWLINGADSRFDNIRSQAGDAIIEDSIKETTVLTAAISAEYGQFGGGVVNAITKSGGNEFSGSARVAFRNQDWTARTPDEIQSNLQKVDEIDNIQTVTFGGPILKDRLWFFLAGETTETNVASNFVSPRPITDRAAEAYGLPTGQTAPGPRPIPGRVDDDERYEIKFSGRIAEGHDITASLINRDVTQANRPQTAFDITSTATRTITRDQRAVTYNGNFTPSFAVELQYSDRESNFRERAIPPHLQAQIDAGADIRVVGTNLRNQRSPRSAINSPQFLGKPDEPRSNETLRAQASYFLTTDRLGSHDITAGYQNALDERFADNRQYVNDWTFWSDFRYEGDTAIPIFSPTSSGGRYQTRLIYLPIEFSSLTTSYETDSVFINDTWTLNDHWRFNIGFRYDENFGTRADGIKSADDDIVSPRLSASYDLRGDGKHEFNASYSVYAQRIGDAADDGSQAGSPSFAWLPYRGPQTENYLEVIDWVNETYGEGFFLDPLNHPNFAQWEADLRVNQLTGGRLDSPTQVFGDINPNGGFIPGGLKSPNTVETRLGYSIRFGNKGYFKADYVHRDFEDFYVSNTTLVTGPTANGNNDLTVINNDDGLYHKEYNGIQTSGRWRFSQNFQIQGNYTWSRTVGNTSGGSTSGILSANGSLTDYPEFNNFPNRDPIGYDIGDQRHIANIFAVYTWDTAVGTFDFAVSERIASGSPYSLAWSLDLDQFATEYGFPDPDSLDYRAPPSSTTYVVTRDAGRGETLFETNLGVTYSFRISKVSLFLEIDVVNIFNQDAANRGWSFNTTVNELAPFNVFTETPIEGVHYSLDDGFGTADSAPDYQRPRSFRFDLGLRF